MSRDPESGRRRLADAATTLAWWSVLALIAVVPALTTNPTVLGIREFPLTVDQVELPRAVAIALLTWLGLAAWAIGEWLQPKGVRSSRIWWVLLGFLLLAGVSAGLSQYPRIVYLGRWSQYEGLLQLCTYGVACFVAAQTITRARLVTLVRAGMVTGAVLAVYGILQGFGIDPANWLTISWWGDRAFATWANPDFFGGYLIFPLTFSIAVMLSDASRRWRVVGAVSLILTSIALAMTLTRGAWLAGILATGLMLASLVRRGVSWKRAALAGTLALVLIVVLALVVTDGAVITRTVNAFKAGDDGVGGRLDVWRVSVSSALDRPAFGSGPNTYDLAMVSRISKGLLKVPDDPHNVVLYLLITLGVPATVAALALVTAALARGARLVFRDAESGVSALPLAAVWCAAMAYAAYLMLCPSIPTATTMFFVSLGVLIAAGAQRVAYPRALVICVAVVGAVLVVASAAVGARGLAADNAYLQARRAAREGRDGLVWAERAVDLNPLNDRYALELQRARTEGQ